jgi:hypothetical protein
MAFGASASIIAEWAALSVTGAIDAPRGRGYDRACGCPTADSGVDFVMSHRPQTKHTCAYAVARKSDFWLKLRTLSYTGSSPGKYSIYPQFYKIER